MDGTTAGGLGTVIPVPPIQPQFSQLTPVYASGPTNTVADIQQPAVKGIEFVQAPTTGLSAPAPLVYPDPVMPAPAAPQLIEPILSSSVPLTSEPTAMNIAPEPSMPQPIQSVDSMSGAVDYNAIENQLENLDLDQNVAVQTPEPSINTFTAPVNLPLPPVPPVPTGPPTIEPTNVSVADLGLTEKQSADKSYFDNAYQAINDTTKVSSQKNSKNPLIIKRILIVLGIVVILGVGGYFGVSAILGGGKSTPAPTTTSQTPTVTQPVFTQPSAATDTTAATSSSTTAAATTTSPTVTDSSTTSTTTTAPATTTSPAASASPAPAATNTTSSPAVSNTGLEW